jgi:Fe2+ transport system protein FeoA
MREPGCPVPLADLAEGEIARLHDTNIDAADDRFLRAIGLTRATPFRVCQRGEPCIIQVRATRVGLARAIANRILVVPVGAPER